jgi:UDP-3-O-[3-hydroxymyristoyl] N-acetylglucosamine deacetylase
MCFVHGAEQVAREQLVVKQAEYGVRVGSEGGRLDIDLVEHLLAALGGLGVQNGVSIIVEGAEVPLLDGGAEELACALLALGAPRGRPLLRVAQAGEVLVGESRFSFEPESTVDLSVSIEFDSPGIGAQNANWNGTVERFMAELAPARTFGFRSQYGQLQALGRARHVDPRAVMVLEQDGSVAAPGAAANHVEFARHKLLDLIGDLYLFGGPPLGKLAARRPGHRANHQAVRQAIEYGLLERLPAL